MCAAVFVLGVAPVLLSCKKQERPRPSRTEDPARARQQHEQAIEQELYGGCSVDAPIQEPGSPIVLESWLASHEVRTVDAPACWALVLKDSKLPPDARPAIQFCQCERELKGGGALGDLLVCQTEHKTRTVIYAVRDHVLRPILDQATGIPREAFVRAPGSPSRDELEWVPVERRRNLDRTWPPPLVYLEPVVQGDSLLLSERPCSRCTTALRVAETNRDVLGARGEPNLATYWEDLLRSYQHVCGSVGEWRWSKGTLLRVTEPFPEPPQQHGSPPPLER